MLTNQAEYKRQLIGFIGKITAVAKFYAQSILLQGNSHVSPTTAFIIIEDGRLVLGTWQGIYFCEFDGPRNRKLKVKITEG